MQQELLDNADDITEEDFSDEDDDGKKLLFILILFGNFDFNKVFSPPLENMLRTFSQQTIKEAVKDIKALGGKIIPTEKQKEIIDRVIAKRMGFILPEIKRVTEDKIGADTYMASDKDTLKQAIRESYAVSDKRSGTIADIEQRTVRNTVRIEAAKASDVVYAVLVSDGQEFDSPCINANGQIWSLDYAGANVLEHPRCVRNFTYLTKEQVEGLGGINVE